MRWLKSIKYCYSFETIKMFKSLTLCDFKLTKTFNSFENKQHCNQLGEKNSIQPDNPLFS